MLDWEDFVEHLDYNPSTGEFFWKKSTSNRVEAGSQAGNPRGDRLKYWEIGFRGKSYSAHRLAWFYVHKTFPVGVIDHIDGNPSNNRIDNLRDVSDRENNQNRRGSNSNNRLKLLGVCYDSRRQKYRATIRYDDKNFHLGYFDTPEEAHAIYLAAKRKFHEGCTM